MSGTDDILRRRAQIANNIYSSIEKGEVEAQISSDNLDLLQKSGKISVFSERAMVQIDSDIKKAEDTGFWKGSRVSSDDIQKAKDQTAKLQKKVVTDKKGGSKTVYIQVHNETKAHHKLTHEELMEHHTSEELHEIAENYRKTHEDVKGNVEKHGAADDSFKSQKATHSRKDVSASEEMYMHIKQAAYKKEKLESKAAEKGKKDVNKPVDFSGGEVGKKSDKITKALDSLIGNIDVIGELEKAHKDVNKLTMKRIIDKNGVGRIVYVRTHFDGKEHEFDHGHKVTFKHGGKDVTGTIKKLKNGKDDQYGTAEIHDEEGNKYSKSLREIDHHQEDKGKAKPEKEKTEEEEEIPAAKEEAKNEPFAVGKQTASYEGTNVDVTRYAGDGKWAYIKQAGKGSEDKVLISDLSKPNVKKEGSKKEEPKAAPSKKEPEKKGSSTKSGIKTLKKGDSFVPEYASIDKANYVVEARITKDNMDSLKDGMLVGYTMEGNGVNWVVKINGSPYYGTLGPDAGKKKVGTQMMDSAQAYSAFLLNGEDKNLKHAYILKEKPASNEEQENNGVWSKPKSKDSTEKKEDKPEAKEEKPKDNFYNTNRTRSDMFVSSKESEDIKKLVIKGAHFDKKEDALAHAKDLHAKGNDVLVHSRQYPTKPGDPAQWGHTVMHKPSDNPTIYQDSRKRLKGEKHFMAHDKESSEQISASIAKQGYTDIRVEKTKGYFGDQYDVYAKPKEKKASANKIEKAFDILGVGSFEK